jgi:hypothetical protein
MTDKPKRDKPNSKNEAGIRINLYMTEARAEQFQRAFELLKAKRRLPSKAELETSRTDIIDYAMDALLRELEAED